MKIYCEKCRSTQFLKHLGGCEAWKVAVEKPKSLHAIAKSSATSTPLPEEGADPKRSRTNSVHAMSQGDPNR